MLSNAHVWERHESTSFARHCPSICPPACLSLSLFSALSPGQFLAARLAEAAGSSAAGSSGDRDSGHTNSAVCHLDTESADVDFTCRPDRTGGEGGSANPAAEGATVSAGLDLGAVTAELHACREAAASESADRSDPAGRGGNRGLSPAAGDVSEPVRYRRRAEETRDSPREVGTPERCEGPDSGGVRVSDLTASDVGDGELVHCDTDGAPGDTGGVTILGSPAEGRLLQHADDSDGQSEPDHAVTRHGTDSAAAADGWTADGLGAAPPTERAPAEDEASSDVSSEPSELSAELAADAELWRRRQSARIRPGVECSWV